MSQLLAGFPVVIELPVAWGEMDAFGHLNNVVYFRYFESARIAYFERCGMLAEMEQTGVGPILASTQCRFKLPLTYPDRVSVGTRVPRVQADRFVMEYRVVSHRHDREAAVGEGVVVWYDYHAARKALIPDALRQRMARLATEGAGADA